MAFCRVLDSANVNSEEIKSSPGGDIKDGEVESHEECEDGEEGPVTRSFGGLEFGVGVVLRAACGRMNEVTVG